MRNAILLSLGIICAANFNLVLAQSPENIKGDAAILFAYIPKEGEESQFIEGYKSHLDWHRKNNDPFSWYGWYVISGDRVGMFIDGAFGISFQAFDNRIAPVEDAVHFQKFVAPYSDVAYRKVFILQKNLSTSTVLERWQPTVYINAYSFSLVPGKEPEFDGIVSSLVLNLQGNPGVTMYRQLTGGRLPTYLMMVHHNGFADFDSDQTATTLSHLINHHFEDSLANQMLEQLSKCIEGIYGETWVYRRDLSYFPE